MIADLNDHDYASARERRIDQRHAIEADDTLPLSVRVDANVRRLELMDEQDLEDELAEAGV